MQRCLILSARRYDFRDDNGRAVEGVTLSYLTGDVESSEDLRGVMPMTISAPVAVWPDLTELPGFYNLDFKQRPGRNGRPSLQVVGVRFEQGFPELLSMLPPL